MTLFRIIKNVLLLIAMFVAGVLLSYLYFVDIQFLHVISSLAGGNLLSPIAILCSAAIASTAAYVGLKENNQRHIKEQTLKVLSYKRYTWTALRSMLTTLDEILLKKTEMTDAQFDEFIQEKRDKCPRTRKIISFLDSYQHVAFGIKNGLYHADLTKLMIGPQLCFFYEKSKPYIEWRRTTELDGPAKHSGLYNELEGLASQWSNAGRL